MKKGEIYEEFYVNEEKLLLQYKVNSLMLLTKVRYTALVNKLSKVIAEKG